MFGLEDDLHNEIVGLRENVEFLEETIAELRAELAEMTMFRDNAVENQKAMEDLFIDTKSNFEIFIRYHRKVVE